jgi:hypothetical protein
MNELTLDGKTYISSKRAAEITGYAKDYVGQLCREGRIEARLVGRNWYVLESSVREHRFGKGNETPEAEKAEDTAYPSFTWGEPRYKAEVPTAIPTLSERLSATEDSSEMKNEVKAGVLSDMQAAWQEWFTKKEQSEAAEDLVEESTYIEEKVEMEETTDDNQSDDADDEQESVSEALESSTGDLIEEAEEESGAVTVTLHVATEAPNEVLDLSKVKIAAEVDDEIEEDEVEEGEVIEETIIKDKKGSYILLRSALVALMLIVVAITAIGTGYVSKYDNYGLSRISEIKFIAGVSEYNK